MKEFNNIKDYTEFLLNQPQGVEKVIRLACNSKGLTGSGEVKVDVEPYKDRSGRSLGAYPSLSREQQESGEYIPHGTFKSIAGETIMATKVTIAHGTEFNLENEVDRKNWEFVQHTPYITMNLSDFLNNKKALFYVELPATIEAEAKVSNFELRAKAFNLISNSPSTDLRFVANMLNYNLNDYSDSVIKQWLYEYADENALKTKKLIDTLEAPDYSVALLMLKAIERGVIVEANDMYSYHDTYLGRTKDQVKEFLKDPSNKSVVEELNKDLKIKKKQ